MSQSLFPARPAGGTNTSNTLVSFNAGKCNLTEKSGGKFLVTPDPRRGTVILYKDRADGVIHFKWSDRSSGQAEDDLMVFPQYIEFKRVKTGMDSS